MKPFNVVRTLLRFLSQTVPDLDAGAKSAEDLFEGNPLSLQLIDFGRSIDTTLLPPGTSFSKVVKCSETMCTEMREGKQWREHIDYYGIAAVSYCLLFQNYIEVVQVKSFLVPLIF